MKLTPDYQDTLHKFFTGRSLLINKKCSFERFSPKRSSDLYVHLASMPHQLKLGGISIMIPLAPQIYRKRLIIEGRHYADLSKDFISEVIISLSDKLGMTITEGPVVTDIAGGINPIHAGLEGQAMWVESGVQLYTWNDPNLFTLDTYSCKSFVNETVLNFAATKLQSDYMRYIEILSNDDSDVIRWKTFETGDK